MHICAEHEKMLKLKSKNDTMQTTGNMMKNKGEEI